MKKRGEAGPNIANFVLMIALFLLAYIILLPEPLKEEWERPYPEIAPGVPFDEGLIRGTSLLSASPGIVRPLAVEIVEQTFPSISLFSTTETQTRLLVRSLEVSKGFFSEDSELVEFTLSDLEDIDTASVLFQKDL